MNTPSPETERSSELKQHASGHSTLMEKLDSVEVPAARDLIKTAQAKFHLHGIHATGPLRRFNPTNVRMRLKPRGDSSGLSPSRDSDEMSSSGMALLWRARDNRKGRRSIAVPVSELKHARTHHPFRSAPRLTSHAAEVGKGIWRMFTHFPYWDMSFWVGFWFTFGSLIWVTNGLMAWLPVAYPEMEMPGEVKYGVGITSFVGVMAFQVGATLAYLEGVNDGSWHGSMMRRVIDGRDDLTQKKVVDDEIHSWIEYMNPRHHHKDAKPEVVEFDPEAGWADATTSPRQRKKSIYQQRRGAVDMGSEEEGSAHELLPFRWWPTWQNLKEHHVYEIGFLAGTVQFTGATIFIITGVVALPGILDTLKPWQENLAYWIPQMIASLGFIGGSGLFVLETQEKWWRPQPRVLGWWVGAWALAGSIGFELCACLGPASYKSSGVEYQLNLTSFWASCCFLISSVLQWYESVNKNPIEELFDEPGEMKSWQLHPI